MKRSGFTLIEIMIVVGIIAIMLASAVMSVASGRGAVKVKEATRGVIQLSRYASALALLRQRPVVVTFHHDGKIEVRISGEATASEEGGSPSDPIYREVDGKATLTAEEYAAENAAEEEGGASMMRRSGGASKGSSSNDSSSKGPSQKGLGASGSGGGGAKSAADEKNGFFYTRRVLDPEMLAKEDAEGEYAGVTFTVEVLGEDGAPLARELAEARSLRQPKRTKKNADGEPVDEEEEEEEGDEGPVSVTYETNGNVNPHRIIIRLEGESEAEEGLVINVSRSGKATVGDDEDENGRRNASRVRSRRR